MAPESRGHSEHYRELITRVTEQRKPRVGVVDFGELVCPGGPPCEPLVDGRVVRPDGIHLSPEAALYVAERLMPDFARLQPRLGPPPSS